MRLAPAWTGCRCRQAPFWKPCRESSSPGKCRRDNVPASHSLKMETNIAVPMRDGTILYADIYRPEGPGPFPVLLQRTPYDKSMPVSRNMLDPLRAARHGYAVVIQDTRGRYTSESEFYPFRV